MKRAPLDHYVIHICRMFPGPARLFYLSTDLLNWEESRDRAQVYTSRSEAATFARSINRTYTKKHWFRLTVGVRSFPRGPVAP